MPEEEHTTPTTIREVGIHIGYIRGDILELKNIVKEISTQVITREEFEDYKGAHKREHDAIEKKLGKRPWAAIFLSGTLMTVLTATVLYVVNDILKG